MRGRLRWLIDDGKGKFGLIEANGRLYFFDETKLKQSVPTQFKRAIVGKLNLASYVDPGCHVDFKVVPCHKRGTVQLDHAADVTFDVIPARSLRGASQTTFSTKVVNVIARCARLPPSVPSSAPPPLSGPTNAPQPPPPLAPTGTALTRKVPCGAFVGGELEKVRRVDQNWPTVTTHDPGKDAALADEAWRSMRYHLADAWLDFAFAPETLADPLLIHVAVIAGGKGDLVQALKLASHFAGKSAHPVGVVTLPDNEPRGAIVESVHTHSTQLLGLHADPKVELLVSGPGGLGPLNAQSAPPYLAASLVIGMIQPQLYQLRLKKQLGVFHEYFSIAEGGVFMSEVATRPIERGHSLDRYHTGMGVSPIDRGILAAVGSAASGALVGLSSTGNNAAPATRTLLLQAKLSASGRRLYLGYGHIESYLRLFLFTVLALETRKNDGADVDVCMPTSWLNIASNVRFDCGIAQWIAQATTAGDVGAADEVTLYRALGAGDTAAAIPITTPTSPNRRIRILDPFYSAQNLLAPNARANPDPHPAGLAMQDMAILQTASEPFALCTGENTLAEYASLQKTWLYEVIDAKEPYFQQIIGLAAGLKLPDASAYLLETFQARVATQSPASMTPTDGAKLATQLVGTKLGPDMAKLNAALNTDFDGYAGIDRRVNRMLWLRGAKCTTCKLREAVDRLEDMIAAFANEHEVFDNTTTTTADHDTMKMLLAFHHELVTGTQVANLQVDYKTVTVRKGPIDSNDVRSPLAIVLEA